MLHNLLGPQNKAELRVNPSSKVAEFVPGGWSGKSAPGSAGEGFGAVCQLLSCFPSHRVPPPWVGPGLAVPHGVSGAWAASRSCGKRLLLLIKQHRSIPAHQSGGREPSSCLGAGINAAARQHKLQLENGRSGVHLLPLTGFKLVWNLKRKKKSTTKRPRYSCKGLNANYRVKLNSSWCCFRTLQCTPTTLSLSKGHRGWLHSGQNLKHCHIKKHGFEILDVSWIILGLFLWCRI